MIEAYSSMEMVDRYFGDDTHEGAQLPFNFLFIEMIRNQSTAYDYKDVIDEWMLNLPVGRTANWVVCIFFLFFIFASFVEYFLIFLQMGNHDQHRVASRLGTDRVDMVNMILLTLPGASVNYNVGST